MPLSPLLHRYDQILIDLDGCVWVGDEATPQAPDAIAAGMRIVNGTASPVDVVAAHDRLDFAELREATRRSSPGSGAIVAALEYATERTARTVGKPEPQLFATARDRLGPGRPLVVGDGLGPDLGGAAAAGLDAAIVLTGATSTAQAEAANDPAPVAIAETLYTLVCAA